MESEYHDINNYEWVAAFERAAAHGAAEYAGDGRGEYSQDPRRSIDFKERQFNCFRGKSNQSS